MNTNVSPCNDHCDEKECANKRSRKPPVGGEPVYGVDALPLCYLHAVKIVAGGSAALTTIGITIYYSLCRPDHVWILYSSWIWWVAAPPIWFSAEYFWLFKKYGRDGTFEAFKYGQDLASKAWFGLAAILTGLVSLLN